MDRPKRRKGILIHRVQCAECGDFGYAEIDKKTGKILSKNWRYWGKLNLNTDKTDKFYYRIPEKPDGHLDMDHPIKENNPHYDPKARPKNIEYWENLKCFSKAGNRHFKIKSVKDDKSTTHGQGR